MYAYNFTAKKTILICNFLKWEDFPYVKITSKLTILLGLEVTCHENQIEHPLIKRVNRGYY